jgi:branched-chain amino acid aminotransferase
VVALERHLARLAGSAAALGLTADLDAVRAGIAAVLAPGVQRVRVTIGSPAGPVVVGGPAPERGAPAVRRSAWVRNERSPLTGHKSTAYAADALALADAREHGGDEALLADTRGRLSEGATSNVYVEVDGELLTPSLASGCLPGVLRALVLAWSAEEGLPVREADLPWTVLERVTAGEAGLAISNALRGFVPARSLDGTPVAGTPLVGAVQQMVDRRVAAGEG